MDEIKDEFRDSKDEKANVEHKLRSAELRANEFEQKYQRLLDNNNQRPSQHEHAVLVERNIQNLKIIQEYEQKNESLESYRTTLSSREAQLEQLKHEYDELSIRARTLEQSNRDFKKRLKVLNEQQSVRAESSSARFVILPFDFFYLILRIFSEESVEPLQLETLDQEVNVVQVEEQVDEEVELAEQQK